MGQVTLRGPVGLSKVQMMRIIGQIKRLPAADAGPFRPRAAAAPPLAATTAAAALEGVLRMFRGLGPREEGVLAPPDLRLAPEVKATVHRTCAIVAVRAGKR